MLFPHYESKTHNLGDNYKQKLETEVIQKCKNDYNKQALKFLLKTGTGLQITKMLVEKKEYGLMMRYHVAIFKAYEKDAKEYELFSDFYQSVASTAKDEHLNPYDVLANISTYAFSAYASADEVYDEFGEMKPSQAQSIHEESVRINRILKEFYSADQLELLSEII